MLKIKIIAFVLALLLAVQILPIAQIGSMLGANQWTEELPHNSESPAKGEMPKFFSPNYLPPSPYSFLSDAGNSKTLLYIHTSEQIPSNHSTDVVTPPPDYRA